jgi:hypothetical protein
VPAVQRIHGGGVSGGSPGGLAHDCLNGSPFARAVRPAVVWPLLGRFS